SAANAYRRVRCSEFDVQSSMFRVRCSEFDVQSSMFRVRCSEFDVQSSMFDVQRGVPTTQHNKSYRIYASDHLSSSSPAATNQITPRRRLHPALLQHKSNLSSECRNAIWANPGASK